MRQELNHFFGTSFLYASATQREAKGVKWSTPSAVVTSEGVISILENARNREPQMEAVALVNSICDHIPEENIPHSHRSTTFFDIPCGYR
jgi:hypothetical protein